MDRLVLGKAWIERFNKEIPYTSIRMRTRMAWHLAALSISTDDELGELSDVALCRFKGGSPHFQNLRSLYLAAVSTTMAPAQATLFRTRSAAAGR